ncbi:MAG: IS66 family transposase [Planctomycetota bacterium]
MPDPGDGKLQNRLIKQRRRLLTYPDDPHADPTNNAAERALRPAVIARKLSCGNKTQRGKRTWEILVSLGQTAHQCGRDFIDELAAHAAIAPDTR